MLLTYAPHDGSDDAKNLLLSDSPSCYYNIYNPDSKSRKIYAVVKETIPYVNIYYCVFLLKKTINKSYIFGPVSRWGDCLLIFVNVTTV